MILWLCLIAIVMVFGWIRFAPSDPAVWHVDPKVTANQDLANGVRRRIEAAPGLFEALEREILATARTTRVAGSATEGHATFVTRSQWAGFPDYTTLMQADGQIEIWGRSRFGGSDWGVNKARVDGWLDAVAEPG